MEQVGRTRPSSTMKQTKVRQASPRPVRNSRRCRARQKSTEGMEVAPAAASKTGETVTIARARAGRHRRELPHTPGCSESSDDVKLTGRGVFYGCRDIIMRR